MADVNNCTFTGHIGQDPELVTVGSKNTPKMEISLAISNGWGERKSTAWTKVVVWGKQAEWLKEASASKGDLVLCSGVQYTIDSYENDKGEKIKKHFYNGGIGSDVRVIKSKAGTATAPSSGEVVDDNLPF